MHSWLDMLSFIIKEFGKQIKIYLSTFPFLFIENTVNKCRRKSCHEQLEEKVERTALLEILLFMETNSHRILEKETGKEKEPMAGHRPLLWFSSGSDEAEVCDLPPGSLQLVQGWSRRQVKRKERWAWMWNFLEVQRQVYASCLLSNSLQMCLDCALVNTNLRMGGGDVETYLLM